MVFMELPQETQRKNQNEYAGLPVGLMGFPKRKTGERLRFPTATLPCCKPSPPQSMMKRIWTASTPSLCGATPNPIPLIDIIVCIERAAASEEGESYLTKGTTHSEIDVQSQPNPCFASGRQAPLEKWEGSWRTTRRRHRLSLAG